MASSLEGTLMGSPKMFFDLPALRLTSSRVELEEIVNVKLEMYR